jgi:hypothetical protein
MTSGNDTITASLGTLSANDRITDGSITDSDTLNATLSKAVAMDVTNVETINITYTGYGAPTFDLVDVSGATVKISGTTTGYVGNATFSNVEDNNITSGAGVTGTLTVDGYDGTTITAESAATVTAGLNTEGDGDVIVHAGVAETVRIDGAETIVLTALSADDVTLTGTTNLYDEATVNLGVDADLVATGATDSILNLNSDEDITVTLDAASRFEVLNLGGDGDIDLDIEVTMANLATETAINNGGVVTFSGTNATKDLSLVEAAEIRLADATAATLSFKSGANIVAEVDMAAMTFKTEDDYDTDADSITLTLEAAQTTQALTFDAGTEDSANDFEDVTIIVAPNSDFDTDTDFVIANLEGNNVADDGSATAFTIASDDADVNIVVSAADAAQIDASDVAGEFTLTAQTATDEDLTVIAAAGATTANFAALNADSTFISQNDADDVVTFDTTGGNAVAQFAGGDNSVSTAGTLGAAGTVTVLGADGDETVTIATGALGTVTLLLEGGDDDVTLNAIGASAIVTMDAGSGDDTVTMGTPVAGSTLDLDWGAGTSDTLVLATSATIASTVDATFAGLEIIQLTSSGEGATDATVDSAILDGKSYEILGAGLNGEGALADELAVTIATTVTSFDASGLDVSDGTEDGVLGLIITGGKTTGTVTVTGSNGADHITGSAADMSIAGGAGSDTIVGAAGDDTLIGGTGADDLTGAAGENIYVFASGDGNTTTRIDEIIDFAAADDSIKTGIAGTTANFDYVVAADGDTSAEALADANAAFDAEEGDLRFVFVYADAEATDFDLEDFGGSAEGIADGVLFIDWDGDGDADQAILLTGVNTATEITFEDIIA